ncbi:TonB-dependent receptor [Idiomarina seosinensis]|uniref:TonB-dependent receptor n=1 Tax=Idiomarina seosinensis TaxID=281739 RepID=UPI00384EC91F
MFKKSSIALAVSLASVSLSYAQQTAETTDSDIEIINVTADFQRQTINEIPQSVGIIDAEQIDERNAEHLQSALNAVANVNFAGGTSTAQYIQIRGIGERSQFVDTVNPSVGLLIDGIDYSGLGAAASLFDIGQVEVFRGPQSGRFGVNALAGMIVLDSEQPTDTLTGKLLLSTANYDEYRAGFAVGGEIANIGNARLSVTQFANDGFTENRFLQRDDTEQRDELSARLGLQSELTENWRLQTNFHHIDIDNGYDAFSLENDRQTLSDEPGTDALKSSALRLETIFSGFQNSELSFAVSGLQADSEYSFDEDWTYVGIAPGWEYSSFDAYFRDRNDTTLEARWRSTKPTQLFGQETDWTAGVYYYRKQEQLMRDYFNWDLYQPSVFNSDQDRSHWALYGELIQQLDNRWSLVGGLRLERYDTDYVDSNGVNATPEDDMIGGTLSLRYQFAEKGYWYGTLARGYKAGGVNGEALGRAKDQQLNEVEDYLLERATFQPEILWNLESGIKWSDAADRLSTRVTVFYNQRDDVQLKSWINQQQSFVGFLENAAEGTNYGVEFEGNWQIIDRLAGFASVGLLESEIEGFTTADGEDKSGREQAHAPQYTANVGLRGQLTEALEWSVQGDFKDSFYFSNSHDQQSEPTALLHAQLSYYWQNWQFSLWGRNLTDDDTEIRGFYFGNDPRDEYVTETYVQYGEPRRYGFTAEYRF